MGRLRVLALALILAPAVAHADQPTAKQKREASDLVKKAIAKSQAGDHAEAVELYESAYKIIPQPLLLSNIGSEYQQMDKRVEALTYFCRYLEADPNGNNRTYATAQAKAMYIELGGVGTVKDEDVCKPIVKEQPDEPVAAPPPEPEAKPLPPAPPPKSSNASPLRWIGLGIGVVGLAAFGVGAKYGLDAQKISDEISNHGNEPWPATLPAREAEGQKAEDRQVAFMIGGGAAVVVGTVLFILGGPKASKTESVSITPTATPESFGLAAVGTF